MDALIDNLTLHQLRRLCHWLWRYLAQPWLHTSEDAWLRAARQCVGEEAANR